jgi:hypothetical protein
MNSFSEIFQWSAKLGHFLFLIWGFFISNFSQASNQEKVHIETTQQQGRENFKKSSAHKQKIFD